MRLLILIFCLPLFVVGQGFDFETTLPSGISANGSVQLSTEQYRLGTESLKWDFNPLDTLTITSDFLSGNISEIPSLSIDNGLADFKLCNLTEGNDSLHVQYFSNGILAGKFTIYLNFYGWGRIQYPLTQLDTQEDLQTFNVIDSVKLISFTSNADSLYLDDVSFCKNVNVGFFPTKMVSTTTHPKRNTSYLEPYERYNSLVDTFNFPVATADELEAIQDVSNKIGFHCLSYGAYADDFVFTNPTNSFDTTSLTSVGVEVGTNGKIIKAPPYSINMKNQFRYRLSQFRGTGQEIYFNNAEKMAEAILFNGFGELQTGVIYSGISHRDNYFWKDIGLVILFTDNLELKLALQKMLVYRFYMMKKFSTFYDIGDGNHMNPDYYHYDFNNELVFLLSPNYQTLDQKVYFYKAYHNWIDRTHIYSKATLDGFKEDGTIFHHRNHYLSYGVQGIRGMLKLMNMSRGYPLSMRASQDTYKHIKDVLVGTMYQMNQRSAPCLGGRSMSPLGFSVHENLMKAFVEVTKDYNGNVVDAEFARMFKLYYNKGYEEANLQQFPQKDYTRGEVIQQNFSPHLMVRKNNWSAIFKGYDKTAWGAEVYSASNHMQRYQSDGTLEIMYNTRFKPDFVFQQSGYDFNKRPGTTSRILPPDKLDFHYVRYDLRQTKWARGVRFNQLDNRLNDVVGEYGMFAMDLQHNNQFNPISNFLFMDSTVVWKKTMFYFGDMIVAVGSNINSDDAVHPMITTLYQSNLVSQSKETYINSATPVTSFPSESKLTGSNWVLDPWGTGYYCNSASDTLKITRENQEGPSNSNNNYQNGVFTNGDFATAWIDHGTEPTDAKYDFVIMPDASPQDMVELENQMNTNPPYEIIQQNDTAHVVKHYATGLTGVAIFEKDVNLLSSDIKKATETCVVMYKKSTNGRYCEISLANGESPIGVFVNYPPKEVFLTIVGEYTIKAGDPEVTLVSNTGGETVLSFMTSRGRAFDVTLENLSIACTPTSNAFSDNFCYSYMLPSGTEVFEEGTFMDTLVNAEGCDSLIQVTLTQNRTYNSFAVSECNEYELPSGNATVYVSGIYNDTIYNVNSCDSVLTINVEILSPRSELTETACDSLISPSGNYTWYSSGNYTDTLISTVGGCDSIISVDLTINYATASTISAIACDEYVSPSGNYIWNSTGIYIDTIPNTTGCDSIISIDLTINNSTTSMQTAVTCNSYTSPSGNYTWTSTGVYADTIPNAVGCDSIISIDLTINNSTTSMQTAVACNSYTSPSGNYTWTSTGVYADTIPNAAGCDSIISIDLTVNNSTTSMQTAVACNSYTSPSGNYTWTSTGVYVDTIPNVVGCDSIITTDLTINNSTTSAISIISCDDYTLPSGSAVVTSSGIYIDTIPTIAGCDSILTIDLTINNSTASTITVNSCEEYTSPSGNQVWNSTGTYLDTVQNAVGCDSIITVELTINNAVSSNLSVTSCLDYTSPSGNYTWTNTGIYLDTLTSLAGCDSIITINLTIETQVSAQIVAEECDSYTTNDGLLTITTSGMYFHLAQVENSCDTLYFLDITINQSEYLQIDSIACDEYVSSSGVVYTDNGVIYDTLMAANGCDSILEINLEVITCNAGVDDVEAGTELVYPNPTTGELIFVGRASETYAIRVTDNVGRLVANYVNVDSKFKFDITNEAKGMYVIYVESLSNGNIHTHKVVKQ